MLGIIALKLMEVTIFPFLWEFVVVLSIHEDAGNSGHVLGLRRHMRRANTFRTLIIIK